MTPEEENVQLRAALRACFSLIENEWGCDYGRLAEEGWHDLPDIKIGAQLLVEEDLKNESHHP